VGTQRFFRCEEASTDAQLSSGILCSGTGKWIVSGGETRQGIPDNDMNNRHQKPPSQELITMDLDRFISQATTARGIHAIRPEILEALIPVLKERDYWVTRLEASEIRGKREIVTLELSVIGLDGAENWESHFDVDRHTRLIYRKIEEAKASGLKIEFHVWIEKDD
jgi:hypothetical protein